MKKNLMFLTLLISVLMISVVSAGITGYVLSRGQLVPGTSAQIGQINVRTDTVAVDGTPVAIGETFTRSGKTFEVVSVEKPRFFGRAKANIQEVAPSAKSGVGSSKLLDVTEEECADNCQALTEVYKLDEGETLTIGGDAIYIDFIDPDQVKLSVNGQVTDLMNEDQWFELSNGQILNLEKIRRLEVAGEIGYVKLGVGGYKLDEGETITLQGNTISISYMDTDSVELNVNGQPTALLSKGNWIELNNGQIAVVEDIHRLEIDGEIGYVRIVLASCYFPYL